MIFLGAIGSSPAIAGDKDCNDPKWSNHPICTGTDPEPDPGDSCANFYAPDFVFWRDSTSKRVPAVTIFLAETHTGCEKELLRIDLSDSGPINLMWLTYSAIGAGDTFFGRIAFEREEWLDSSRGPSVWKYDFEISDGQIQPTGDPVIVLENNDPERQYARGLDLSPDTGSLVWKFGEQIENSWNQSIHIVDIDNCTSWPCDTFDGGQSLVEYIYHTSGPGLYWGTYLQQPVWGPYGDRIYFVAKTYQPDLHSHYVMAIESDGNANGVATEIFGIENQVPSNPNYRHIRSVSSGLSGWPDLGEYLAVEIGDDNLIYSCADVYTLNVAACEDPKVSCKLQYETHGSFASWTRTGAIILSGLGSACKFNQIGIWDDGDLNILTKGYEPEAAGGEVEVAESR
jgi:hypothetical protein